MTDWVTFKEAGAILGVNPRNMRQIPGFADVAKKPGAPQKGHYYSRADLEKLAAYRNSGELFQDSYAERQAGIRKRPAPRKPTKSQQLSKDGRTVDPLTYLRNRARIKAQEEAVRSGKLKPKVAGVADVRPWQWSEEL